MASQLLLIGLLVTLAILVPCRGYSPHSGGLTDALLRQMVDQMGNDLADPERGYLDLPARGLVEPTYPESRPISVRDMKESILGPVDFDDMGPMSASVRDPEYLAHSSLLGSMLASYMPDGRMRVKPLTNNIKHYETKTEGVLPAYCNPPNPCPVGYSEEDGCIEDFDNTARFSREYQGVQDCMCDTEHMFECQDSTRDSEINALARSIQNEGMLDSTIDKIMQGMAPGGQQRVMNKKYSTNKSLNPYLQGDRLPIAAKKGHM